MAKSAAKVIRENGRKLAMYHSDGGPLGSLSLRKFLSKKLATTRGIKASADEIMITSGSTQGILLINDSFLDPGDTVIKGAHVPKHLCCMPPLENINLTLEVSCQSCLEGTAILDGAIPMPCFGL